MTNTPDVLAFGRRFFLRGVGGTLLAIPFLESLLPRTALGQPAPPRPRFYVSIGTAHGAAWFEHMFPTVTTETTTYAGRTIRRGALVPTNSNGMASLSTVLTAPSTKLTSRIASKLNVIAGLDMGHGGGHQVGGHLGCFNEADPMSTVQSTPTIDQVMAYSPDFYPDLSQILLKSMQFGNTGMSWNFSNPVAKTGAVQQVGASYDTAHWFSQIFTPPPAPSTRVPVVDRVYENYQRLLSSNRRLSTSDRLRLEDYVARVAEIQRRSKIVSPCSGVQPPTKNAQDLWGYPGPPTRAKSIEAYQLINDVIVAAFLCGSSRIATVAVNGHGWAPFYDYSDGDWHGIVHNASNAGVEGPPTQLATDCELRVRTAYQGFFEDGFLDLVRKLDVDSGSGGSILDDALVSWTQESGHSTHAAISTPVVTAGSAGGALKTGSFIDYRNLALTRPMESGQHYNPGLLWNQWLGTQLQAMRVSPASYEVPLYQGQRPATAVGGYAPVFFNPAGWAKQKQTDYDGAFPVMGEVPPYLKPA